MCSGGEALAAPPFWDAGPTGVHDSVLLSLGQANIKRPLTTHICKVDH